MKLVLKTGWNGAKKGTEVASVELKGPLKGKNPGGEDCDYQVSFPWLVDAYRSGIIEPETQAPPDPVKKVAKAIKEAPSKITKKSAIVDE